MKEYQKEFIRFAIDNHVLQFGEFTLKSGRKSPYFFNAGLFQTGVTLSKLGEYYAECIQDEMVEFDVLFGPAYKGIPLVTVTATSLARKGRDVPLSFNRKEAKDHGEGGKIVGAALKGKIFLVDDVITAGTAIRESIQLIRQQGAELVGVLVALDRMEKGSDGRSAIQQVEQDLNVKVYSLISMRDVIEYLEETGHHAEHLEGIKQYRKEYGV